MQADGVHKGRKEASRVHDASLVGHATGSNLVREKFGRIRPERRPSNIISAVRKENGDKDANGKILRAVGRVYYAMPQSVREP